MTYKRIGPLHIEASIWWRWDRVSFWRMMPHRHISYTSSMATMTRTTSVRKCSRCCRVFNLDLPDPWLSEG